VCSGVTVAARMTPGQPAPSVAAAGVPLDALPPIEHAPGFVRYEVGKWIRACESLRRFIPRRSYSQAHCGAQCWPCGGHSLHGKRNRLRLNACATAVKVRAASAWPSIARPDC